MAACDACLRRTDLIVAVSGSIDIAWREREGRTSRVLARPDEELLGLDPSAEPRYEAFSPALARRRIAAAGLSAVCRCEPGYPDRLRELPDPPAVLHIAGAPEALPAGEAVAIVGSRRATPYGLEVSTALGRALTGAGVPVVSGMALGIDSAAHLRGARRRYAPASSARRRPRRRRRDAVPRADAPPPRAPDRARRGRLGDAARLRRPPLVLPRPQPHHRRALDARPSSSRPPPAPARSITADLATDLGRTVAAVPGPVTSRASAGANELLHAGAAVIRDARDALDLLFGSDAPALPDPDPLPPLDPAQRRLLEQVERGHGTVAELARTMEEAQHASRTLSELELLGLVRREFGGRYVRCL